MKSFANYDGEFGAIPKILAMSVTERAFVNFFLLSFISCNFQFVFLDAEDVFLDCVVAEESENKKKLVVRL